MPGVPVRGTCAAGHTVDATSSPGRVTWEGPCTHGGCELKVHAKRVPKDRTAKPADAPAPAAANPTPGARKLIVTRRPDAQRPKAGKPAAVPAPRAADDDTGEPGGVRGPGPDAGHQLVAPAAGGDGPHHATGQTRDNAGKWRSSLRTRIRRQADRNPYVDDDDELFPGVF